MSAEAVALASASGTRKRAAAYLELTKPRVLAMVLLTTLVGFYLGSAERFERIAAARPAALSSSTRTESAGTPNRPIALR